MCLWIYYSRLKNIFCPMKKGPSFFETVLSGRIDLIDRLYMGEYVRLQLI